MNKLFGAGSPTAMGRKKEKKEVVEVEPTVTEDELAALLEKDEDFAERYGTKNQWKQLKRTFIDLSVD